jgi:hypothetical protein
LRISLQFSTPWNSLSLEIPFGRLKFWMCKHKGPDKPGKDKFFPPECYVISFTDGIEKEQIPRHEAGDDQTMATIPEKTKLGNHSA